MKTIKKKIDKVRAELEKLDKVVQPGTPGMDVMVALMEAAPTLMSDIPPILDAAERAEKLEKELLKLRAHIAVISGPITHSKKS